MTVEKTCPHLPSSSWVSCRGNAGTLVIGECRGLSDSSTVDQLEECGLEAALDDFRGVICFSGKGGSNSHWALTMPESKSEAKVGGARGFRTELCWS